MRGDAVEEYHLLYEVLVIAGLCPPIPWEMWGLFFLALREGFGMVGPFRGFHTWGYPQMVG